MSSFPGMPGMPAKPQDPNEPPPEMKALFQALGESCPVKVATSGAIGFVFGGAFGMFMSSVDMGLNTEEFQKMSTKDQFKYTFKDMMSKSYASAKNMAVIGAVFSGSECIIESYRAKNDIYNGVSAGCFTGAVMSARAGPQAMVGGCIGFAAFSAAIDYWIRHSD
ncbi:mitochondrial import inner membrane translocase subunit tim22 [Polychytrium aggregatum]|uniref:mitochondrial import inner membrane translocase subunit tim22 n=1 Tax=Polychytrium aggregatum TaxID=110093 RepID=UPI0022FECD94|nr:mitochondrial import inner membrane translocase subunit tim22 [Polychytrium aggregatum]KAI9209885.1 mitochondrial import inner membrane translocase subunit tim22 [Polychytrium aggregatum]